jgi:hypothetical protein
MSPATWSIIAIVAVVIIALIAMAASRRTDSTTIVR